jgi:hypothetical protein
MKSTFYACVLFITVFAVYPQESEESPAPEPVVAESGPVEENSSIAANYVISKINYHVEGWTRPFAIASKVDLREGAEFSGTEALDAYVARKIQDLRNQRVFEAAKCRIEYSMESPGEDGKIPVILDVYVEDSWNIIALPEPKFDSNTGFSLTLKARDYNFLGTMNPLSFDIGYKLATDEKHTYGFLVDADIPFRAAGLDWVFNFDNKLDWTIGDPLSYRNVTGVSIYVPWKTTAFWFGFNQFLYINEENSKDEKKATGIRSFPDTWYMASQIYGGWRIPTGLTVLNFGSVDYIPGITETLRYRPGGDTGDWRRPVLSLGHSIGFGRIDWQGNYRQGFDIRLGNNNDLNQYYLTWSYYFYIYAVAYYRFTDYFGIAGRFRFQRWWNGTHADAGDVLRGLHDDTLTATKMLSLNLEFPFRLIRFVPSEWFRRRKWRIFDFEQQWSPFIDFAMADDPQKKYSGGAKYTPSGIITTMGLEVITFPLRWRSIYLRVSIGWDMREWLKQHNPPAGSHRELYIGLGHFF